MPNSFGQLVARHLIDITARPFTSHSRHRIRWASWLIRSSGPSRSPYVKVVAGIISSWWNPAPTERAGPAG